VKTSLSRILLAVTLIIAFRQTEVAGVTSTAPAPPISTRPAAAVYHDTSRALREVVGAAAVHNRAAATSLPALSPALTVAATGLTIVQNFPGIATPPNTTSQWASDATGAPGSDHYMQAVNFSGAIFDKQGNLVLGPFPTSSFWDGFSGPCGGTWSDVIVLYDQDAGRWFVSRFARQNSVSPLNWYQCFAISTTSDPTGTYYRYAFLIDPEEFNDYPKFGVWPDGYYMTADRDKIFPGTGNFVAAFERNAMLNGNPAGSVVFKLNNGGNRAGMLPADWDGHTAPPAGAPNYLIRTLDTDTGWPADALEVWALQVDWANSLFNLSLLTTLAPAGFNSAICGLNQNCIPQPDPTMGLDPLAGGRPMFRLAYRNLGSHESLVFNQTVDAADVPNHGAPRWYELRKSGNNPWAIQQQNTYAPDADHRWIGSIAMDQAGNMAMGYTTSGTATFPSVRVAARLAGDPLNTFTEEVTIQAGSGSQTGFVFWADYSHMDLDPADDCTFWYTGTYQPVTSALQTWATRIAAFRFPGCEADLAVVKTRAPAGDIVAGTNVAYTISVTNNGPVWAGNVTLQDPVPAETTLVSFASPAGWDCDTPPVGGSGMITCTKPSMANGETAEFTVVARIRCTTPDGTVVNNTASVSAATPPDPDDTNDAESVSFTVENPVPLVDASVALGMLPQNNHDLTNVGLSATISDGACPTPPAVVQVFSDEDDEAPNGQFSPDAKDIALVTLRLRQERVSQGDGRVYLIVVKATDEGGGTGFDTVTVTVPKSQSPADVASVNAQAAAAKGFADLNSGAPPAGYSLIGDGPVVGPKQ
jgi:uncharacterized repeat protein (TIGR01451 family)